MNTASRLLSIGEFAAATQLSPKALRLYDEQRLMPPAQIDAANGYRYYRIDQVRTGRLIRTLREMGLTLADIAIVVATSDVSAEQALSRFAKEQDNRHAREKRAFHSALVMLRQGASSAGPEIVERTRAAQTIAVQAFSANRLEFVERFRSEENKVVQALAAAEIALSAPTCCALIDPLSEDGGRLELIAPIAPSAAQPIGIEIRHRPMARYASVIIENPRTHAADLTSALDALFDWFDRHAYHAVDSPVVAIGNRNDVRTEIQWAYE